MCRTLGKGFGMRLIKSTLSSGNPGGLGIWGGREQGSNGGPRGLVYEQPGTEVDDSCHNWRVPSKWKRGLARGFIARGSACIDVCIIYNSCPCTY